MPLPYIKFICLFDGVLMPQYFSYIVAVSFIDGEKHRPVTDKLYHIT